MRVVLPAWRLLGPRGGVGNYLWHLLREYGEQATGDEFLVLHDGEATVPPAGNISARRLTAPLRENNLTWCHLALPAALRREQADLLHNVSYILPRGVRCPSVVTIHDVAFLRYPEWFPRKARWFYTDGARRAARRADRIVTDSRFAADEIAELLRVPEQRLRIVPLAAGPEFKPGIDPAPLRARLALPERFILYVGGVRPRRQVDLLVEACARVLPGRPEQLVFAGPTQHGDYDLAAHAASLGLGDRLTLLGFVPEEDLPALYTAATLFAWPSIYEGFGLPPLEALACGTPTLVCDAASLPEVVGDAALRVRADSTEALADGLAALLDDSALRARLSAAGPVQAARFSWRQTAAAMLRLYREVAP